MSFRHFVFPLLLSVLPVCSFAQTVTMYPLANIQFKTYARGVSMPGAWMCPKGGDFEAFEIWAINNEMNVKVLQEHAETRSNGKAVDLLVATVQMATNRIRYWSVRSDFSWIEYDQKGVFGLGCHTIATLQGDRIDDGLTVNIGLRLNPNAKKPNEGVEPILVTQPGHCAFPLLFSGSAVSDTSLDVCKKIGMKVDRKPMVQTQNIWN